MTVGVLSYKLDKMSMIQIFSSLFTKYLKPSQHHYFVFTVKLECGCVIWFVRKTKSFKSENWWQEFLSNYIKA